MDWDNFSKPKDDDPLGVKNALAGKQAENKPTIEEKIAEVVTAPPDEEEIKTLREHMAKIEKDHDGISNIPHNHLYYDLRNRIQRLENK